MKTITIVTKLGNICVSISKVQVQSSKFKYCFRTSAFEKKNTTKMDLKRTQFDMEDYLNSSRRGGLLFSYYMTYFREAIF